ncbi:MAG: hypothetical protein ACXAEX_18790 [Promethearchaeota archaeon]
MNEGFEVEVITCCPECGHSYGDRILFDVDCPFLVENSCKEFKGMGGCTVL